MSCDDAYESKLRKLNYNFICGVDEVGRGALFGPVVAGAVILDPLKPITGLDDSKKLTPKKRLLLAQEIYARARAFSIGWCWNDEIDRINILQATKKAMKMAVKGLQIKPDYVLMDGMKPDFLEIEGEPVIKGDSKCVSIASASIIAKVFRDDLVVSMAPLFPRYAIEKNKGYGTRQHIEAIEAYGHTRFHRRSFKIGKEKL